MFHIRQTSNIKRKVIVTDLHVPLSDTYLVTNISNVPESNYESEVLIYIVGHSDVLVYETLIPM